MVGDTASLRQPWSAAQTCQLTTCSNQGFYKLHTLFGENTKKTGEVEDNGLENHTLNGGQEDNENN